MRERAEPRREVRRRAVGPRDREGEECRLIACRCGLAVQREAIAADRLRSTRDGGSACGEYAPLTRMRREKLEVRLRRRLLRVDVDDDAIRAPDGKETVSLKEPVRRDRRMVVDDRAEVAADEDHVHARCAARRRA